MGNYLYKVTANRVALEDGTFANIAVYAFKPTYSDEKENAFMRRQTACFVSDRFVKGSKYTGRIVLGSLSSDGKTAIVGPVAYNNTSGTVMDYELSKDNIAGKVVLISETGDETVARVFK